MSVRRRRVVILRDPIRGEPLRAALAEAGLDVVVRPVTRTEHVGPQAGEDWPAWVRGADWVVFTSLNGVNGFAGGLGGDAPLISILGDRRLAVLGATAAGRLGELGVRPELIEATGTSAELAARLLLRLKPGSTVLYPGAEQTLPALPQALAAEGHRLRKVVCYRTVAIPPAERAPVAWDTLDGVLVAAPSAVRALEVERADLPEKLGFYAIGPTTGEALRQAGWRVLGVAESPRVEDLVALVVPV